MSRMVIESSVREAGTDPIFRVAGEAAQRTKAVSYTHLYRQEHHQQFPGV